MFAPSNIVYLRLYIIIRVIHYQKKAVVHNYFINAL